MPYVAKDHNCTKNNYYHIETTMRGSTEIWIVYDVFENQEPEEVSSIIYGITVCPFCGTKL
jgi:hypothetical protein